MINVAKEYTHKVDKVQISVCNIMGVNIAAINMEWLVEFTKKNLKKLSGDYMCVSNVYPNKISGKGKERNGE